MAEPVLRLASKLNSIDGTLSFNCQTFVSVKALQGDWRDRWRPFRPFKKFDITCTKPHSVWAYETQLRYCFNAQFVFVFWKVVSYSWGKWRRNIEMRTGAESSRLPCHPDPFLTHFLARITSISRTVIYLTMRKNESSFYCTFRCCSLALWIRLRMRNYDHCDQKYILNFAFRLHGRILTSSLTRRGQSLEKSPSRITRRGTEQTWTSSSRESHATSSPEKRFACQLDAVHRLLGCVWPDKVENISSALRCLQSQAEGSEIFGASSWFWEWRKPRCIWGPHAFVNRDCINFTR